MKSSFYTKKPFPFLTLTVFLDTIDCIDVSFQFDTADTSTSRTFDITVSQFICGDDNGGPPGCLQYHQVISQNIHKRRFVSI